MFFLRLLLLLLCCQLTGLYSNAQWNGKWGDQGDGTYVNPVLPADYSDIDAIRVGDDYYAISSTMQFSPGMAVLHSKDLVNWEIIGHVVDDLTRISPLLNWDRMQDYGKGIWAGSIRYYKDRFWVYFGTPDDGFFMSSASNPAGPWETVHQLWKVKGWDDCCPFCDDDGQLYFIATRFTVDPSNNKRYNIHLFKMAPDGKSLIMDSDSIIHHSNGSEANKLYKINGLYYHYFSEVKPEGRVIMMERSKSLYGPWEIKQLNHVDRVVDKEPNQGGLIQTASGQWYFFTHHGSGEWEGRAASLLPVHWMDGWPIIGEPGADTIGRMVWTGEKPIAYRQKLSIQSSDEFNAGKLGVQWEWNYQPCAGKWSLTARRGFLRLYAFPPIEPDKKENILLRAGNTLTQRSMRTPANVAAVKIAIGHMADGEFGGLTHFSTAGHSLLGIRQENGIRSLVYDNNGKEGPGITINGENIWLRSTWDYNGVCRYAFSTDGKVYKAIGDTSQLTWGSYRGDRIGIFNFNVTGDKGYLDVDWFRYDYGKYGQRAVVQSPNKKISVGLFNEQGRDSGEWYLKASYDSNGKITTAIPRIDLGLTRDDQDFSKNLKLINTRKPDLINEEYKLLHGKRSVCRNAANEIVVSFENPAKAKLNVIIRAYNDGIAFRYEFPEKQGTFVVKDEGTAYSIPLGTTRWMEKWNPANEGLYTAMDNGKVLSGEWGYPALFSTSKNGCWFLLHEADVDENYCGTKLSNAADLSKYKLLFPNPKDGRGVGEVAPRITLPWKSPWRLIIMGTLADIVGSTLVDDVSSPSVINNTSWIKPGIASWNYWSNNHGTKDYKTICEFTDLAAEMGWPYTLLDWEWDAMGNGGNLEDAMKYIESKGIKPLIWYNSGGPHTGVAATPRDRMLTHQSRVEEFTKLKKMGIAGVKVDFFESEKQAMIKYYLDILKDAAAFQLMVYFHGCMVPRGWERTYPNLMTQEAVRGAEWYNNTPDFTMTAPEHNATLPFTRNVVGSMDYTPVTFTNSQYPHVTSYGHELALSVLFESGIQHMADRPEGYYELPDAAKTFLKKVPNAWDDTQLLDGYPGKEVILARRKGTDWYIGGINAEQREERKTVKFYFLPEGVKYKLTLIADGKHDKDFETQYMVVDRSDSVEIKLLRRGGFVASLVPVQ